MQWYVEYEVRGLGAIGIFWLKGDTVEADNESEARERFRNRYGHRYEFRFPSRCYVTDTYKRS